MKKTLLKSGAEKQIKGFFKNIKDKTPKEVKKIKRLAMAYNLPLKEKRKLFCKKCFAPYKNPKIRIKNKVKLVKCEGCGYLGRWGLK